VVGNTFFDMVIVGVMAVSHPRCTLVRAVALRSDGPCVAGLNPPVGRGRQSFGDHINRSPVSQ
jgi:hypothetical protein